MRCPLGRDEQKDDLVGAYRHCDKISGEISACGINLNEFAAVLVCQICAALAEIS